MSLELYNIDIVGVEQFGQPELLDFWDVVQGMGGHDLLGDAQMANQIDALIADKNRICHQADELKRLMPARQHQIDLDYRRALDEIERKAAKILGNSCVYKNTISPPK